MSRQTALPYQGSTPCKRQEPRFPTGELEEKYVQQRGKELPFGSANNERSSKIVRVKGISLDVSDGHDLPFGSHVAVANEEFALLQIDGLS